ncbi:MAG TPA: hypothetical protein VGS79_05340 [Puia sp.]|nr:hypothetical protein [Puia sp.]
MKYPISIAFLFLSLAGRTQSVHWLANLDKVTIRLSDENLRVHQNVFAHFRVIDQRPDTTRIGIHTYVPTFGWNHTKQLILRHSASAELEDYLNRHFSRPGSPYTALIILRDLWLSDANYLREDMIKDPGKIHVRTHIRLKVEIYATKDSLFMPILRYDTIQVYKQDNRYTGISYYASWDHNLAGILNDMADSAGQLTLYKDGHGRRVSFGDIRNFNHSRFVAPIGVAATLTPGVYTSFEEFRNNAPSIHDFEIRKEHKQRVLYIKEPGGKTYYSHDAWGYCDGKVIFVMRDGILCPAWREGNAFYFLGLADRDVIVPPGFIGLGRPSVPDPNGDQAYSPSGYTTEGQAMDVKIHGIFTIDMDTGDVY